MKQITCNFCGDTYPDFDVAHVCSKGPYAPKLESKMNERIREFARISHLDVYGLGKERYKWEHTVEKFAELIVREMLVTCEEHPAWTGRMIGEQIKQHFGVAE